MEYSGDTYKMKVKDLINELQKYDMDLPICINDYIGFVEANEKTIKITQHKYITFPFTENDEFSYVNLTSKEFDNN